MTKIARFLGTCLLIGSMATATMAGETLGTGITDPPPAPPAESTSDLTSTLGSGQNTSASTIEVMNVLITWLVDSIS